jgi:hypothetical protein
MPVGMTCIVGAGGELVEQRIRTSPERIAAATSATHRGRALPRGLGHQVVAANPNLGPMTRPGGWKVKTDQRDTLLEAGSISAGRTRGATAVFGQRQLRPGWTSTPEPAQLVEVHA